MAFSSFCIASKESHLYITDWSVIIIQGQHGFVNDLLVIYPLGQQLDAATEMRSAWLALDAIGIASQFRGTSVHDELQSYQGYIHPGNCAKLQGKMGPHSGKLPGAVLKEASAG